MITDKKLYQYGNGKEDHYIFQQVEFSTANSDNVKTERDNSSIFSGEARKNGLEANLKSDYIITATFLTSEKRKEDTIDNLLKIFYGKPKLIFFYSIDENDDIVWYYQKAEAQGVPVQVTNAKEDLGQEYRKYQVKLRLFFPEYLECQTDELKYLDETGLTAAAFRYDNAQAFDSTFAYDSIEIATEKYISTLSTMRKKELFENCSNRKTPILYNDRLIDRNPSNRYVSLLPNSPYDIDRTGTASFTLTGTTTLTTTTSPLNLNTTIESELFEIRLDGMLAGEEIKINNVDNQSDLIIKWNGTSAITTPFIFNTYHNRFYYVTSGAEIPLASNSMNWNYTKRKLYFEALKTVNPFVTQTSNNITLFKNNVGTRNIIIRNTKTFH